MSSLSATLLDDTGGIMQHWYEAVRRSAHPSHQIGEVALKNLLAKQLQLVGEQLRDLGSAETPATMWKLVERLDAEARIGQAMPIEEVVLEYGLIVDSVREWLEERNTTVSFREFSYFYQAMFALAAEAVRRYARNQTEESARQRALYLAGVAHQMRTPLAVLSLEVQVLERSGRLPGPELIPKLRRSVNRLSFLASRGSPPGSAGEAPRV